MTVAGRETTRKGQGQPRGGGRSGLLARGCAVGVKGCSQQVECALEEALVLFADTLQGRGRVRGIVVERVYRVYDYFKVVAMFV